MITKFVFLGLSFGIAWLIILLDYKKPWSDKRTIRHRYAFRGLKVLMGISMAASAITIYRDERSAEKLQSTVERVADAVGVDKTEKIADAVQELKQTAISTQARQEEMQTTLKEVANTVGVTNQAGIANAVVDLKTRATAAEQSLTAANEKLSELSRQLSVTDKQAQPPTLTLAAHRTTVIGDAREVILRFAPSKNQSLGILRFIVALPIKSTVKITDLWPTLTNFTSGPDSKKIAPDGRTAALTYALLSADAPAIKLLLSGPTSIQVTGEYIQAPIIVNVQ